MSVFCQGCLQFAVSLPAEKLFLGIHPHVEELNWRETHDKRRILPDRLLPAR